MNEKNTRKPLSDQQAAVLAFLREEITQKGYPPSVREIGEAIGLSSSSTVHGHLGRLEDKGYIRRDPMKPRAIEIIGEVGVPRARFVPVIGRVAAGLPILAEQNVEDYLPIPPGFVRGAAAEDDLFFLIVRGESMIMAGILDGDYILVRRQEHANDGEIVVALVDDEATVKRIFREPGRIRLQPENPLMDPIYVPEVKVVGKVVSLIRRTAE